ncbi:MAG: SDR family oxidoreductase [Myxococcales bacterium]|nr:SDR family oxidoreductase [Myxococcales bacterium]MCB9519347.1 SDR family oxidoreductase [Myxococcales bacterium]
MHPSIFRADLFAGKTAFVTGGGTGIGLAIASELRMLGADVVIGSRSAEKLAAGATKLAEIDAPGRVLQHPCNIRDEASIDAAVAFAVAELGGIDLLVNNGGGQFPSPAVNISAKGWAAVVETNLTGTFLMTRAVAQQSMFERGGGAVVNIIAQMWNGFPMMAHTGAARAGVDNLTKTLAFEWAPFGVRVNAVAPGVIQSSGIDNYSPDNQRFFFDSVSHIPAGRLGTPREIAAASVFLLSPAAGFITGTTLRVDGGEPLFGHAAANQMRPFYSSKATDSYD